MVLVTCDVCGKLCRDCIYLLKPNSKIKYVCSIGCLKKHQWFGARSVQYYGLTTAEEEQVLDCGVVDAEFTED